MSDQKRAASPSAAGASTAKKKRKKSTTAPHPHEDITKLNATNFSFLQLPGEVRNMIYDYFFKDLLVFLDRGDDLDELYWDINDQHRLSLLSVSRQLHHETALLPYKLAVFDFGVEDYVTRGTWGAIHMFLGRRTEAQLQVINRVEYEPFCDDKSTYVTVAGDAKFWAAEFLRWR